MNDIPAVRVTKRREYNKLARPVEAIVFRQACTSLKTIMDLFFQLKPFANELLVYFLGFGSHKVL